MQFRKDHPFPFEHSVFFSLAEVTPEFTASFLNACRKFLSGHAGQTHFSLANRDVDSQRDVSVRDFDVSMRMVFESKSAYEQYQKDKRHDDFITFTAGMSTSRKVFDSYICEEQTTKKAFKPARTKSAARKG